MSWHSKKRKESQCFYSFSSPSALNSPKDHCFEKYKNKIYEMVPGFPRWRAWTWNMSPTSRLGMQRRGSHSSGEWFSIPAAHSNHCTGQFKTAHSPAPPQPSQHLSLGKGPRLESSPQERGPLLHGPCFRQRGQRSPLLGALELSWALLESASPNL